MKLMYVYSCIYTCRTNCLHFVVNSSKFLTTSSELMYVTTTLNLDLCMLPNVKQLQILFIMPSVCPEILYKH